MEHQAEVNRLKALRKLQSQVTQPPPSLNTLYYRTFRAPAKTPEARDSMQVDAAMMMTRDDTRHRARHRVGQVERGNRGGQHVLERNIASCSVLLSSAKVFIL